jgi:lipopolysaccharide export system ATP-binding protein
VRDTTQIRAHHLVDALAHGDRSIGFALHSLLMAADDAGVASLTRVAVVYRDDYLASLRAEGKNADQEAGRLSLDEVRAHLLRSVLPRLAGEGVLSMTSGSGGVEPIVTFAPAVWKDLGSARADLAAALKVSSEHSTVTGEAPSAGIGGDGRVKPSGSVLEASGLIKTYRRRRVVNDVALRLQQGEIVGLLGPNGAGKTTTFYMIVGLIQPLAGRIKMDGKDITSMSMYKRARSGIGYLSQEPSIFRKLTVEDNILAILETLGLSAAERRSRLESLLDELSIKHLRHSKAFALSGGERRRLEITRALVTQPKFMMLDEPFAGVDPIAVHDIQTIVAGLRHRGIGVLISDHNVEQTLDIVDRAYIMFDGQVKVSGTVRELVFDDTVADIYLGPTLTARLRSRFAAEADPARGA